jgi:hypothetical protein
MAFPATSILDDFNRANEGPPPSSNWTDISNGLKVVSNVCVGNVASAYNVSRWNTSFGPDTEVYAKLNNISAYIQLFLRMASDFSTGYSLFVETTTIIRVRRYTGGSPTQIGSVTLATALVVGDLVGLEIIGSNIKVYTKQSGVWAQRGDTVVDSTYSGAGYIGAAIYHTVQQIDDFGGGTVGGTTYQEDLTSLGTSASSIGDIQKFNQVLDSVIQSQSTLIDLQNFLETLDSLIQSQSTLADLQTYKETLEFLIQSVSTESDVKAFVEDLQSTIASISALTVIQNYVHVLDSVAQSAASLSNIQNYIDIVMSTAQSISSIADFKIYMEILDSIATSVSTISDMITLVESLETQIQSEATLTDIQHYFETLLTTIVSEDSVIDALVGQYETTLPFYLASKKEFQFGEVIGVFKAGGSVPQFIIKEAGAFYMGKSIPQFIVEKRYGATG